MYGNIETVQVKENIVEQVMSFKYLGTEITSDGNLKDETRSK